MPRKEGYLQRLGPDKKWHQVKKGSTQYLKRKRRKKVKEGGQ